MVDVKDKEGHTVLQAAVEAAWVPGVCVALEAGADVTLKVCQFHTIISVETFNKSKVHYAVYYTA